MRQHNQDQEAEDEDIRLSQESTSPWTVYPSIEYMRQAHEFKLQCEAWFEYYASSPKQGWRDNTQGGTVVPEIGVNTLHSLYSQCHHTLNHFSNDLIISPVEALYHKNTGLLNYCWPMFITC